MLRIDVVTLFPDMVTHASGYGVTGRARERGLWDAVIREFQSGRPEAQSI